MRRIASVVSLGAVVVLAACSQSKGTTNPTQTGELSGTYVGGFGGPMGGGSFTAKFGSAATSAARIRGSENVHAEGGPRVHTEGTNPALLNFTLLSGNDLTLSGTSSGENFSVSDAAGDLCTGSVSNILTATCTLSTSPAFALQLIGVQAALSGSAVTYCGQETSNATGTPDGAIFLVVADANALLVRVAEGSDTGQAFAGTVSATGMLTATSLHNTNLVYTGTVSPTQALGSLTNNGTLTATWTTGSPCVPTTGTATPNLAAFSAQQGAATLPKAQTIILSGNAYLGPITIDTSFNYQGQAGGWLTVTTALGTRATLAVNTTALQPGTYLATVQLFGALTTNNPLLVHVSYVVTGVIPNLLTVSPDNIYFASQAGDGSNPPGQVVNFTSTGAAVTGLVQSHSYLGTPAVIDWLNYVQQTVTSTPLVLNVTPVNTQQPGQWFGTLTETSGGNTASVHIIYSVAGSSGNVLLSNPSKLTYTSSSGQNPANQTFQVTYGGSGSATHLGVQPQYFANTPLSWILLAINSSTTPSTVTVQIADSTLPVGDDSAYVVVSGKDPTGTNPVPPAVIKIVTHITPPVQQLLARPDTLQFTTVVGANPTPQQFMITSGGGAPISNVSISSVTYKPSGPAVGTWALGTTSGTTTPITETISPQTTGLAAGQYAATYTISTTSSGITPITATMLLTVNPVQTGTPWTSVSVGNQDQTTNAYDNFTCGVTESGASYCWGANSYGEIGDGTRTDRATPTAIGGNLTFKQISAGNDYACGISGTGAAYCWGTSYALGIGGTLPQFSLTPAPAGISGTYSSISTQLLGVDNAFNYAHTCAVSTTSFSGNNGWCWGGNTLGELGNSNAHPSASPGPIFNSHQFVVISASDTHTCGIDTSGQAWCWGYNFDGEEGVGHVYQSGSGATYDSVPHQVVGGHTFTAIAVGDRATCAVATGGTMFCWGTNEFGELGTGQTGFARDSIPTQVAGTTTFQSVVSGGGFFCGITANGGQIWCWGTPPNGYATALPITANTPTQVSGAASNYWTQLAVAPAMICAIDNQGHLGCWGYGNFGDGNGLESVPASGNPKYIPAPSTARVRGGVPGPAGVGTVRNPVAMANIRQR